MRCCSMSSVLVASVEETGPGNEMLDRLLW